MKKLCLLLLLFSFCFTCWAGVDFNGDADEILCGDIAAIDDATSLSGFAWVYHDSVTTDDTIFSTVNVSADDGFWFWRDDAASASGRQDTYSIYLDESGSSDTVKVEGAQSASPATTWTHVAFTWKGGTDGTNANEGLRLYINGVEDANSPADSSAVTAIDSSTRELIIGNSLLGGKEFIGGMTECAIWDTNLTAAEVSQLYNSKVKGMPLQIQPSSLVGYWSLDDYPSGAGTISGYTFKDQSGNGNDGTGVDADNDSDTIGETILSYPPKPYVWE